MKYTLQILYDNKKIIILETLNIKNLHIDLLKQIIF